MRSESEDGAASAFVIALILFASVVAINCRK